ncbi:MAG TPA: hypothetical protein VN131_01450, partial [Mobilitalea sp.]|nr:hypothetical protein [Mobilitalea sp.]
MKEKNEYNNAGGRIVVIFNQAIQDNDLQTLAASMDSHVKIVRHIGDYALFHVNEEEQYYHVINQLKKNPSVKVAQADSKIITTGVTNDAYSNTQWPIENPGHYTYISEEGRM